MSCHVTSRHVIQTICDALLPAGGEALVLLAIIGNDMYGGAWVELDETSAPMSPDAASSTLSSRLMAPCSS